MEVQATAGPGSWWRRAGGRRGARHGCATSLLSASPTTRCSCASCRCTTPSCRPATSTTASSTTSTPSPSPTSRSGRVRPPGEAVARVLSPDRDRDGWHSPHSVLLVVTDDMPFLVDTMRMVLERRGPRRAPARPPDARGRPRRPTTGSSTSPRTRPVPARASSRRGRRSRSTAPTRPPPPSWRPRSSRAVDDVRRVVDDFEAMRDRMAALGDADPMLPWLAAGQFVFLGAAELRRRRRRRARRRVRAASSASLATTTACTRPRPMPADGAVAIARTDDTSRVFRAERQTVVAVDRPVRRPPDPLRRPAGDERLPRQRARHPRHRRRPSPTPSTSRPARMHTHTGRATRTVLENLPRDLVLELEPTALARLVAAIVGLQERQLVRVFEVPEPVGPWITVLVYLPRSRFTAELPGTRRRRRRLGVRRRPADVRVARRRQLARPHRRQRPLPRRPTVDRPGDARADGRRAVDVVARPAAGGARRRLRRGARPRPVRAGRRARPARRTARPCRRSGRSATSAASPRCSTVTASCRPRSATTSTRRPASGASASTAAVQPAALSELLPLLDHLGLQALDERPYTFRVDAERVFVYDIGVRVESGVELDEHRRTALQDAFAALVAGDIESDGYNRLVLQAGLSAREVAMVRAYGKYLRQIGFAFSQSYIEDVLGSHPAARRRSRRAVPHPLRPVALRRGGGRGPRRDDGDGAGASRRGARRHPVASTTTASAAPS